MKRPEELMKSHKIKSPFLTNRLDIIKDESNKAVIPIGPRFQADVPDWTAKPYMDSSSTPQLGDRIWPNKDKSLQTKVEAIGQGRPYSCLCVSPGSIDCVKCHIGDRRLKLQTELGAAFWQWKFDEMGEDISKFWDLHEQQEFDCILKRSSPTEDNNFVKLVLERFPTKRRETIVSYYFNVHVPRRMKVQTRLGCRSIDTDDDEDGGTPCPEGSRKRCRADGATQISGKHVKNNYLSGKR